MDNLLSSPSFQALRVLQRPADERPRRSCAAIGGHWWRRPRSTSSLDAEPSCALTLRVTMTEQCKPFLPYLLNHSLDMSHHPFQTFVVTPLPPPPPYFSYSSQILFYSSPSLLFYSHLSLLLYFFYSSLILLLHNFLIYPFRFLSPPLQPPFRPPPLPPPYPFFSSPYFSSSSFSFSFIATTTPPPPLLVLPMDRGCRCRAMHSVVRRALW